MTNQHDALEKLYKVLHNVAYGLLGCENSKNDHNSWQLLPPTSGVYPKTWSAVWPPYLLWLMGCSKSDTVHVWKSDKKPVSTV